jgi:hypothetical protein
MKINKPSQVKQKKWRESSSKLKQTPLKIYVILGNILKTYTP